MYYFPNLTILKTQGGERQDVMVSPNINFVMFVAKTYLQVFFAVHTVSLKF